MRFVHLSDLHIGKHLKQFSLERDQLYILEQILDIVRDTRPDGVLISGDVYDKSVPSVSAVTMADRFLTDLASLSVPVFVISGNHDSAERLAFGSSLMERARVYLSPVYDGDIHPITLTDEYGEVDVWLLPFLRPAAVRAAFPEDAPPMPDYQTAMDFVLSRLPLSPDRRHVLLCHKFLANAQPCESEERRIGGLDMIAASSFDAFDYVALGHIHSPQSVGRPEVRYCGTPLKYSFSEADQTKSVTVVTLCEKGNVHVDTVPLTPLYDMSKRRGRFDELMASPPSDDYLHVTLTDEEDIPDAFDRLHLLFPHLVTLTYDNRRTRAVAELQDAVDIRGRDPLELFEEFFALRCGGPMSEEQRAYMQQKIQSIWEVTP